MRAKNEKCVFIDTDVAVSYLHEDPDVSRFINNRDYGTTFMSAISYFEIMKGFYYTRNEQLGQSALKERRLIEKLLRKVEIVTVSSSVIEKASKIQIIGNLPDILIAYTAINHGCQVIMTRNVKHMKRFPGISSVEIGTKQLPKPK